MPDYDRPPEEPFPLTQPCVGEMEDIYLVHSSLTTQMQTEVAPNTLQAFLQWTERHGLGGRVHAGRITSEPFLHLSVALEIEGPGATSPPELHEVHVVKERVLAQPTDLHQL